MLQKLAPREQKLLLQAPIYLTLLAANHDGLLKPKEKRRAVKITRIKTFASPPELKEYFKEVDKIIESELEAADKSLPEDAVTREKIIREKLAEIKMVFSRLNTYNRKLLARSLKSYTWQISRINQNLMEEVVMPMLIDFINKRTSKKYFGSNLIQK